MSKALNFNSIERPTLTLTMKDDAQTNIRVGIPKQNMVEELKTISGELGELVNGSSSDAINAIYDLAARLISCNRDFIKVTPEDLRDRYRLDLEDIILFYGAYLDFIHDITHAKN